MNARIPNKMLVKVCWKRSEKEWIVVYEGKRITDGSIFISSGIFMSAVPVGSRIWHFVSHETTSIWVTTPTWIDILSKRNKDEDIELNPEDEYVQLCEKEPTRPTDFLQLYEELEKAKEEIKNLKEENKLDKEHFANYVAHVNAYGSIP